MADFLVLSCTRMGDIVQTTPLLRGLKQRSPNARIALVVADRYAALAHMIPSVDHVLVWNQAESLRSLFSQNALREGWEYHREWLQQLRPYASGTLINLSHSRDSALLCRLLKSHRTLGLQVDAMGTQLVSNDWLRYFYNMTGLRGQAAINLVDVYREALGLSAHEGRSLELQAPKDALEWAQEELRRCGVSPEQHRPLVLMQLGASEKDRCWPVERFAEVARRITAQWGAVVGLLGSSGESAMADAFLRETRGCDIANWVGATTLPQLVALCSLGSVLLANDTGTAHIAASQGTPIVGLFFATAHPAVTAPRQEGALVLQTMISCGPCQHHTHCPHVMCREMIDVDSVCHAIGVQLQRQGFHTNNPGDVWPENSALRIWRVAFDERGYQDLQLVNGPALTQEDHLARAYRQVWVKALGRETDAGRHADGLPSANGEHECVTRTSLDALASAANKAQQILVSVGRLLASQAPDLRVLQQHGDRLQQLDEAMQSLREAHEELRPLLVQFRLEREAVGRSASMKQENRDILLCYKRLEYRALLLAHLLKTDIAPVHAQPVGESDHA